MPTSPGRGEEARGSASDVDIRDEYANLPSGHPTLRPWMETIFISRDAEMDAEEARLRYALLAAAPNTHHHYGLEAARAAVLGLQGVADEKN